MNLEHAIQTAKHIALYLVPSVAVTASDVIATSALKEPQMTHDVAQSLIVKNYAAAASYVATLVVAIWMARYKIRKNQRKHSEPYRPHSHR